MTPEEHLAQLLDEKNETIEGLEEQLEDAKRSLRGMEIGWTAHIDLDEVKQTLPVPRLEVDVNTTGVWKYRLVKGYLSYQLMAIPLAQVSTIGGHQPWPPRKTRTDSELGLPTSLQNVVPYDAAMMNLPAFIVGCGHIQGIVPWPRCSVCSGARHPEWLEDLTCHACRKEQK